MYLLPLEGVRGVEPSLWEGIPNHQHRTIIRGSVPHQFVTTLALYYETVVVQIIDSFALGAFQPKTVVLPLQSLFSSCIYAVRALAVEGIEFTIIQVGAAYYQTIACTQNAGLPCLNRGSDRHIFRLLVVELYIDIPYTIFRALPHHAE